MESVQHETITKSWIETGLLAILTDVDNGLKREYLRNFLDFLRRINAVRRYEQKEIPGSKRTELTIQPYGGLPDWVWAYDLSGPEAYFAEVDGAYGWRFLVDRNSYELLIERIDKATEAQG